MFCLGVPQGLASSLHLFLIRISDLPDGLASKYKIFGGDISLQTFLILITPGKNQIVTWKNLASGHSY